MEGFHVVGGLIQKYKYHYMLLMSTCLIFISISYI
jgi:hypothetical protein